MSGRKLGGGRVLGSGRSLSAAVIQQPPIHQRTSSLLSPSASTVSLDSSSTSQTSPDAQDLKSRVSLVPQDENNLPAAAASSRLFCPICNDEMVTLLQLNRHLDDIHKNLEEERQDEVKDWFRTQVVKAKKFQPLAVLNQKLKGLDVFESNDTLVTRVPSPSPAQSPAPVRSPAPAPEPSPRLDPDDVVTKAHWQRPGPNDTCLEPMCGKRLNATNGKVNCRHCGKLFCEEHTMYQMKLSRSAQHEPVRGFWCRVCETCYKSRDGYMDHNGLARDHSKNFASMRKVNVDKLFLEVSRLEKRLTRLTQLLANPPEQNAASGGLLWPLSPIRNQRKELEQTVVTWENDATVSRCPFCQQEFSSYTFRRHHCRTCGRVVCGDPNTGCSSEVGFNVDVDAMRSEKPHEKIAIDIRMCKDCQHTVFSRKELAAQLSHEPPDVRAYKNLIQFERGIRLLLPKFQHLLSALQDPDKPPTTVQLADASKVRKRLMDSFAQYDVAARRIRDMPTESETQKKLQKAVYQQATNFLHLHMLPLKSLPKILKHATPGGSSKANGALASIKINDLDAGSHVSSSSAITALEEEEKTLRERLIILEEQKFMVQEMVTDANKRRKFDEATSLSQNLQDLTTEIDQVQGQLSSLDFAGVYAGNGA